MATKKVVSKKATHGRPAAPVTAQKILKSGKLGKATKFSSIKEAAAKVAPNSKPRTSYCNILCSARGWDNRKSAYGYVWSF